MLWDDATPPCLQLMSLVEVVRLPGTPQAIIDAAIGVAKRQGKTPVVCEDTPGFIVNALLVPYLASAMTLLDKGVAGAQDIDVRGPPLSHIMPA